jgi:light-regulated signal transduction histidine kinase (bacteriophytochrome)
MSDKLESQLKKARQELATLKMEYDEFVYIVSHDLSAPLRQIEGFTEIIASRHADSFDEKTKRHLALIQGGSNQAKLILEAIRGYSHLNTMTQSFALLDLNKIVSDTKVKLLAMFDEVSASITCSNLPTIVGDKKQMTQLLECLIHNALTYQPQKQHCKIDITVVEQTNNWQFCITDNGIGVDENVQNKIFKVLKRGVSDKKFPGIGMGLAIAHKIIQRHDGRIWLESNNSSGSAFYFTIAKHLVKELPSE